MAKLFGWPASLQHQNKTEKQNCSATTRNRDMTKMKSDNNECPRLETIPEAPTEDGEYVAQYRSSFVCLFVG